MHASSRVFTWLCLHRPPPPFFFLTRLACVVALQVHLAKMKGGAEVAVKVQRAGLKALFDQDLQVKRSPTGFNIEEREALRRSECSRCLGARGVDWPEQVFVLSIVCAQAKQLLFWSLRR